jgi:hypothetical protein
VVAAVSGLYAEGDFVVAWQSEHQDGSGYGVYAQRYGANEPPTTQPAVTAAEFVYQAGGPQRVRLTFNQDVRASLSAADLTVQRTDPGGGSASVADVAYDAATRTATFTFTAGTLPDGNYRATLLAPGVTHARGTAMAANYVLDFFVLAGDINRDRAVNGTDFAILAGNFGRTGMTFAQGDLNGDGSVNGGDFSLLAGHFGRSVPPPPAPQAVAAARSAPPAEARRAPASNPLPATAKARKRRVSPPNARGGAPAR